MWSQFLFEIAHFATCLFTALVLFATFWLYQDAWKVRKTMRGFLRTCGFLFLSISYVVSSAILEATVLKVSLFSASNMVGLQLFFRNLGYLLIFLELASEKIESRPKTQLSYVALPAMAVSLVAFQVFSPVLALLAAIFYSIKAVIGLEAHVKPAAAAFFLFTVSELLSLLSLFRQTTNVTLFHLLAPFGIIWIAQHVVLLLATLVLGRWVFGYLLKQFEPQLFMMFSALTLAIFLITTTVFTGLLLKSVQDESLNQLESDAKVLQYALDSKRTEGVADVIAIAQNPELEKGVADKTKEQLGMLAEQFLLSKKYSTLLILDDHGQVIARGEDKDNIGSFLNDDSLVKRAKAGEAAGGFITTDGVLAPVITLRAVAPVKTGDQIIGTVVIGTIIDNAFVDGIKKATGLQASLYGNNTLSATTLLAADNTTRLTGITENNQDIIQRVFIAGQNFKGGVTIGNTLYFAADLPLLDTDNTPIGMIFVGREQQEVLQAAGHSVELTFIATAVMLVLSIIPSFFISRHITQQIR
ncbi:MAG: cache domain-containing protein [Patescibacteria group bacterium]